MLAAAILISTVLYLVDKNRAWPHFWKVTKYGLCSALGIVLVVACYEMYENYRIEPLAQNGQKPSTQNPAGDESAQYAEKPAQLETVDHPILGKIGFPVDMGPDERNESIQRAMMDKAQNPAASVPKPNDFPSPSPPKIKWDDPPQVKWDDDQPTVSHSAPALTTSVK